jgi:uncharacterized protein involved in cysteine biosynthesis
VTSIIQKTIQDILSPKVLIFIILVGSASVAFWVLPLWWLWGGIVHGTEWIAHLIPWTSSWKAAEGSDSFWTALKIGYIFVTITISIATAIWGESILHHIAQKHYPTLMASGTSKIHRSLYYNLKANIIFLLLLIVSIPFLFIPFIGKIILLYLWSIQIKEPTTYDVGALLDFDNSQIKSYAKKSRWMSLLSAALNFIPIVNFFVPLFAQILFLHLVLGDQEKSI